MIKSDYRKYMLAVIARYRVVPATPHALVMLIRAHPGLVSIKKFNNAYSALQKEPYQFLKKSAVIVHEKNSKDAIKLTSKGIRELKELGIKLPNYLYSKNLRDNSREKHQYILNEAIIFFIGSPAYQEKIDGERVIKYYCKNNFTEAIKSDPDGYEFEQMMNQYSGSRVAGILESASNVYAVYNLKSTNMTVVSFTENKYIGFLVNMLDRDPKQQYDKILLADSFDILQKTILQNNTKFIREEVNKRNNLRRKLMFTTTEKYSEINRREKMYLLINDVNQQELVELFKYANSESMIKSYIKSMNSKKISYDKKLRENNNNIGTTFGRLAAYETDDEVGFYLVQQELNYIYAIYLRMNAIKEGNRRETRRLRFFGVEQNKEIFNKVFTPFENVEFVEMNLDSLLLYIKKEGKYNEDYY